MRSRRQSTSSISAALLGALLLLTAATASAAGTYKWTDDQGVVHYTDHMPTDSVSKGATVLDKQGRAVKKIDPAPTAEQRKQIEADEEQRRATAKAQAEQLRKDRALTLSFSSEAEIDVARLRIWIEGHDDRQLRKTRHPLSRIERFRAARSSSAILTNASVRQRT